MPNSKQNLAILSLLLRHGFISSVNYGSATSPDPLAFREAPISQRRLWANLKFREQRPVLGIARFVAFKLQALIVSPGDIQLISKPSKRIRVSYEELVRLLSGHRAQFVKPIGLGEVVVLKHAVNERAEEWMDGREALQRGLGGELVLRVK